MVFIAITGVPGTGKTTIAKKLKSKLSQFEFIDVTKEIKDHELYSNFDQVDQTYEVDSLKFESHFSKLVDSKKNKNVLFEGHLAHLIEGLDFVIYLIADIEAITSRLTSRGYSQKKIQDNTESQIMNVIEDEIKSMNYKFAIVDTSKNSIEKSIEEIDGFFNLIGLNF